MWLVAYFFEQVYVYSGSHSEFELEERGSPPTIGNEMEHWERRVGVGRPVAELKHVGTDPD